MATLTISDANFKSCIDRRIESNLTKAVNTIQRIIVDHINKDIFKIRIDIRMVDMNLTGATLEAREKWRNVVVGAVLASAKDRLEARCVDDREATSSTRSATGIIFTVQARKDDTPNAPPSYEDSMRRENTFDDHGK